MRSVRTTSSPARHRVGPANSAARCRPSRPSCPGSRPYLDRLPGDVRDPEFAVQCHRRLHRSPLPHGDPAYGRAATAHSALAAGELLIDTNTANSKHLSVGSVVPVKFAQTGSSTLRIGGIFQPNALIGSYLVGDSYFLSHYDNPLPVAVLLQTESSGAATGHVIAHGASGPTRTSRYRPGPDSRNHSKPKSTNSWDWSMRCSPWPW